MRTPTLLTRWFLVVVVLLGMGACANVPNPHPRDPYESFNRSVFKFNDAVDTAVLKPVAQGYVAVTPSWFRTEVSNFFNNLKDVWSVVNNGLQGKGTEMGDSIGRVMVNTTLGLGGLLDVASDFNIDRHSTNFGDTLGQWGVKPGPYIVLPFLGPSTLRETAALPIDWTGGRIQVTDDPNTALGLTVLSVVDLRANLLGASDLLQGAALDPYSFMRDAYLQRQRNKDYDGDPPPEEDTAPESTNFSDTSDTSDASAPAASQVDSVATPAVTTPAATEGAAPVAAVVAP